MRVVFTNLNCFGILSCCTFVDFNLLLFQYKSDYSFSFSSLPQLFLVKDSEAVHLQTSFRILPRSFLRGSRCCFFCKKLVPLLLQNHLCYKTRTTTRIRIFVVSSCRKASRYDLIDLSNHSDFTLCPTLTHDSSR